MIKVCTKENLDENSMIELWQICFGDSKEYVEFFLENCPDFICIQYYCEEKLASQLFLLDSKLNGERIKYLYAACTHPIFRKRGIMKELIRFSRNYCEKSGYSAIFLVPANEHLYDYYKKLDFVGSFGKNLIKTEAKCLKYEADFKALTDIDEVFKIRNSLLKKIDSFCFCDDVMKYSIKEHLFNGGNILFCNSCNQRALVFYYFEDKNVVVKELLSENQEILTQLIGYFYNKNAENLYIFTPIVYNFKDIGVEYTKCGMCLPLNKKFSEYLASHKDLYAALYLD